MSIQFLGSGLEWAISSSEIQKKKKKRLPTGASSLTSSCSQHRGWVNGDNVLLVCFPQGTLSTAPHQAAAVSNRDTNGPWVMPAGSWHSGTSSTDCELKAAPSPVKRRAKELFRLHIPSRETKNIQAGRTDEMVSLGLHSPLYFFFSPFSFSFLALFPIPSPFLWLFFPSHSVMTSKLAQHRCSRS